MSRPEPLEALPILVDAFEDLGIAYAIGGSVASIAHGFIRATADVDIVGDLRPEHVEPLVNALQEAYYIDGDMIREALRRSASFNVIFLATVTRVDVFVLKPQEYDQLEFRRAIRRGVPEDDRPYSWFSVEDVDLHKLEGYRAGDRTASPIASGGTSPVCSKCRVPRSTSPTCGKGP